jgi:hypothetical protein
MATRRSARRARATITCGSARSTMP